MCLETTDVVCVCAQLLSFVRLFAIPWTVAWQASLSMKFPRQEYWSGLPFPPLGDLPNPETEPASPVTPVLAGRLFAIEPHEKPNIIKFNTCVYLI